MTNETNSHGSKIKASKAYPFVAIGASAGGLEAITHLLKGDMYAESEPGQGARFHVILPVKQNLESQVETCSL